MLQTAMIAPQNRGTNYGNGSPFEKAMTAVILKIDRPRNGRRLVSRFALRSVIWRLHGTRSMRRQDRAKRFSFDRLTRQDGATAGRERRGSGGTWQLVRRTRWLSTGIAVDRDTHSPPVWRGSAGAPWNGLPTAAFPFSRRD